MTCTKCNHNSLEQVISVTNSIYSYCPSCKNNMEKVFKNVALDSIFNEVCKNLKYSVKNNIKIEIIKNINKLHLNINNIEIYSIDFLHNFSKTDIYFIENTLHDLIEDLLHLDCNYVDILVCA